MGEDRMKQVLNKLLAVAKEEDKTLFMVGGVVRDALLGLVNRDVDLLVLGETEQFAKRVAYRLGGDYEPLDTQAGFHRITLVAEDGLELFLDFSEIKRKSVEKDLMDRDFTVNAMSVPLERYLAGSDWPEHLIDPCGGKADLLSGVLKVISEKNLVEDPVRLIRPVRFLMKLGLVLDPESSRLICKHAAKINKATRFRVATELFLLLKLERATEGLRILHEELQLLGHIFPPAMRMGEAQKNKSLISHGLDTCGQLDVLLSEKGPFSAEQLNALKRHLRKPLEERRSKLSYLKIACLLHDVGKLDSSKDAPNRCFSHEQAGDSYMQLLSQRLRLSQTETAYLSQLVCNHSRPHFLAPGASSLAGRARFFKQFKNAVPELVLLSWANMAAHGNIREGLYLREILDMFFAGTADTLALPLISAAEVMEFFNLPPNRSLGALLEETYSAQLQGHITSKDEAISLISVLINNK
jgi:poly(A) polymerase